MKKDKRILLAITGIALLLGGCGANQPKQKANNHKEVKTENVKSDVQSSTSTSQVSSNKLSMNDLSSPKLLAAAVIDFAGNADQNGVWSNTTNEWNNVLNSPSKQWTIQDDGTGEMETFPTRSLPDANAADSCPTTYTAKGDDISIWESGTTRNVSKNDILSFVNGEYKLPNGQTSDNSVAKVKEIANAIEIKPSAKNSSESSSQNSNGNVDTKNLTTQQVCNWITDYCHSDGNKYITYIKPKEVGTPTDHDGYAVFEVYVKDDNGNKKLAGDCYRVDKNGNLQVAAISALDDMNSNQWQDTNFPYPGN